MKKLIIILVLLSSFFVKAQNQDEIFNEFALGKEVFNNEKWSFNINGSLKFNYDRTVGWKKWGLNFGVKRKLNNWSLSGGIANYYIINKALSNSYEFRPWLALGLKTSIIPKLNLRQQVKTEWRNISYKKNGIDTENFGRFRYKIGFDYILVEDAEYTKSWKIKGDVEWYLLRNSESNERYPSLREYTMKLVKKFQNGNEVSFGFELLEYYKVANHKGNGYTFVLGYQL